MRLKIEQKKTHGIHANIHVMCALSTAAFSSFAFSIYGKEIACHIDVTIKIRLQTSVCLFVVCFLFLIPFTCLLILHPFHVLWNFSLHAVQIPCGFDDNATTDHSPFRDRVTIFPAAQRWVWDFYAVRIHIAIVLWQLKLFEMRISGSMNWLKRCEGTVLQKTLFVDDI